MPCRTIEWLGIEWLGLTGQWRMLLAYKLRIRDKVTEMQRCKTTTRRNWEALVGLLNFACQIHSHLRVLLQPLTKVSLLAPSLERDKTRRLPTRLKTALEPWMGEEIWQHTPSFQLPNHR